MAAATLGDGMAADVVGAGHSLAPDVNRWDMIKRGE